MANDKRACEPAGMAAIYKPDPRLRRVARHLGMRERTRDVVKIAQSVRKATFPKRAGPSVTVADLVAPWRPGRPPQAEGLPTSSGQDFKNFPIDRVACRMRCSFSTSAKRTYPSPSGPNPIPGETATSAFSISSLAKALVAVSPGIGFGYQRFLHQQFGELQGPVRA